MVSNCDVSGFYGFCLPDILLKYYKIFQNILKYFIIFYNSKYSFENQVNEKQEFSSKKDLCITLKYLKSNSKNSKI